MQQALHNREEVMTHSSQPQTIADQINALHSAMASRLAPHVLQAFGDEREALNRAGVPESVLRPGQAMPDAELFDVHGAPTTLAALRAGAPAVVVFYRGDWCPYCNLTLRTYQQQLTAPLRERGVVLAAVSPQRADGSLNMKQKNDLEFAVLSDPGNVLAGALGILTAPSPGTRAAQAELGLDIATTNADNTAAVPMPTTVIVDAAGVIRWVDAHPDYTTRSEPADILQALHAVT